MINPSESSASSTMASSSPSVDGDGTAADGGGRGGGGGGEADGGSDAADGGGEGSGGVGDGGGGGDGSGDGDGGDDGSGGDGDGGGGGGGEGDGGKGLGGGGDGGNGGSDGGSEGGEGGEEGGGLGGKMGLVTCADMSDGAMPRSVESVDTTVWVVRLAVSASASVAAPCWITCICASTASSDVLVTATPPTVTLGASVRLALSSRERCTSKLSTLCSRRCSSRRPPVATVTVQSGDISRHVACICAATVVAS